MTLPLTPEMLEQAYEYLRTTPPFNRWNMPEGEDVVFRITRSRTVCGQFSRPNGKPLIEISVSLIGYTPNLMSIMAHEMVHLHQNDVRMETPGAQHNAAFRKLALQVCKCHGFDPRMF